MNATLNHLHSNLGHGHGPIITAADISPSAAIRPEQTTFGSSLNRSLVYEGTFMHNPDASMGTNGSQYIPVNFSGSLSVSVVDNINGFVINGVASTGNLTDGGVNVYTVMYKVNGADAGHLLCVDSSDPKLYSPLQVVGYCDKLLGDTPVGGVAPPGLSVMVFDNKVN